MAHNRLVLQPMFLDYIFIQLRHPLNYFPRVVLHHAPVHTIVLTSQIRENLHVILCFSPMAPEFRNRARKFPALVSCTVIDWFQPWPKEALASVGTRFLAKSIYLDGEGLRAGVEQFMINSFEGVNTMCTKVRRFTRALTPAA